MDHKNLSDPARPIGDAPAAGGLGSHLRAFSVRYIGATNYKPSRVKIVDERGISKAKTISYDSVYNNAFECAAAYMTERGWQIVAHAEMREGALLLVSDFRREYI